VFANAPFKYAAVSGASVFFVCIGLVCTKITGFLFVKIRRESKIRYEDFSEEAQENMELSGTERWELLDGVYGYTRKNMGQIGQH
jgi:hypothetical protein